MKYIFLTFSKCLDVVVCRFHPPDKITAWSQISNTRHLVLTVAWVVEHRCVLSRMGLQITSEVSFQGRNVGHLAKPGMFDRHISWSILASGDSEISIPLKYTRGRKLISHLRAKFRRLPRRNKTFRHLLRNAKVRHSPDPKITIQTVLPDLLHFVAEISIKLNAYIVLCFSSSTGRSHFVESRQISL